MLSADEPNPIDNDLLIRGTVRIVSAIESRLSAHQESGKTCRRLESDQKRALHQHIRDDLSARFASNDPVVRNDIKVMLAESYPHERTEAFVDRYYPKAVEIANASPSIRRL